MILERKNMVPRGYTSVSKGGVHPVHHGWLFHLRLMMKEIFLKRLEETKKCRELISLSQKALNRKRNRKAEITYFLRRKRRRCRPWSHTRETLQ